MTGWVGAVQKGRELRLRIESSLGRVDVCGEGYEGEAADLRELLGCIERVERLLGQLVG